MNASSICTFVSLEYLYYPMSNEFVLISIFPHNQQNINDCAILLEGI